jgi:hypothetical protein
MIEFSRFLVGIIHAAGEIKKTSALSAAPSGLSDRLVLSQLEKRIRKLKAKPEAGEGKKRYLAEPAKLAEILLRIMGLSVYCLSKADVSLNFS